MVLFLFVIMLLGAERLPGEAALPWQRPLAFVLAGILVIEIGYLLVTRAGLPSVSEIGVDFGSTAEIGSILYNAYLLPFEITSVLLLVAMIGSIVLTVRQKKQQDA